MLRDINLSNYKDPQIEMINGIPKYIDIVNKKARNVTEEEKVRQKFLQYLHKKLDIPYEAMSTEEILSHHIEDDYDRMDICVEREINQGKKIVMVIECKAPDIALTEEEYNQAKKYAIKLDIPVIIITNGHEIDCIKRNSDNTYEDIPKLPTYEELKYYEDIKTVAIEEYDYKRWSLEELHRQDVLKIEYDIGNHISNLITKEKAIHCLNLAECFLDVSHKVNNLPLKKYTFVKDEGIYKKKAGNPIFDFITNFRLIKIKDKTNNIKHIGFAIVTDPYPALFVGTYYKHSFHNAIELNLHRFMYENNNILKFVHDYTIYHEKKKEFKEFVDKTKIFENDENGNVMLGEINASKLLYCDNPQIEELMAKLIEYSILRDEYRIMKENEKKMKENK